MKIKIVLDPAPPENFVVPVLPAPDPPAPATFPIAAPPPKATSAVKLKVELPPATLWPPPVPIEYGYVLPGVTVTTEDAYAPPPPPARFQDRKCRRATGVEPFAKRASSMGISSIRQRDVLFDGSVL